jgi:hypothetical protein
MTPESYQHILDQRLINRQAPESYKQILDQRLEQQTGTKELQTYLRLEASR